MRNANNRILLFLLLSAVVLLHTVRYTAVVFSFSVNRDYVSRMLCVKKEVENNSCKGKCFLQRKLAEEDSKEEEKGLSGMSIGGEDIPWQLSDSRWDIIPVYNELAFPVLFPDTRVVFKQAPFMPPDFC